MQKKVSDFGRAERKTNNNNDLLMLAVGFHKDSKKQERRLKRQINLHRRITNPAKRGFEETRKEVEEANQFTPQDYKACGAEIGKFHRIFHI